LFYNTDDPVIYIINTEKEYARNVNEAITRLKGITCGGEDTSCPDQFAKALEQVLSSNLKLKKHKLTKSL